MFKGDWVQSIYSRVVITMVAAGSTVHVQRGYGLVDCLTRVLSLT